jgi:hypothetical protein
MRNVLSPVATIRKLIHNGNLRYGTDQHGSTYIEPG